MRAERCSVVVVGDDGDSWMLATVESLGGSDAATRESGEIYASLDNGELQVVTASGAVVVTS